MLPAYIKMIGGIIFAFGGAKIFTLNERMLGSQNIPSFVLMEILLQNKKLIHSHKHTCQFNQLKIKKIPKSCSIRKV